MRPADSAKTRKTLGLLDRFKSIFISLSVDHAKVEAASTVLVADFAELRVVVKVERDESGAGAA